MTPRDKVISVPSIGPESLELFLTVAMKSDSIFSSAKDMLDSSCFIANEMVYSSAWLTFVNVSKKAGQMLSTVQPVITELMDIHRAAPDSLPKTVLDSTIAFLTRVEQTPKEITLRPDIDRIARVGLRRLIAERKALDPLRKVLAETRGYSLEDPRALIDRATSQLTNADSLLAQPAHRIRPHVPFQKLDRHATGIVPIDLATGGGVSPRKVYGIFGPFGSYKTGLSIQLAVAAAMAESARARIDPSYQPGLVFYAVYEGGRETVQLRASAIAAAILKDHVESYLSGLSNLASEPYTYGYEREFGLEKSEVQRYNEACDALEPLRILDMSGSYEAPNVGKGYIPELTASIDNTVMNERRHVTSVFVDYAKVMARRHAMETGKIEQLVHLIGALPDQLRACIAEKHNTPLWIVQQLDAEANKKRAGAATHHSQSSWAKDFAENLWYAFTLSTIDKLNGHTVTFNASKTRDTEGLPRPQVLQIDRLGRLTPTTEYTYDMAAGRIISSNVQSAFGDAENFAPMATDD